MAFVIADRVRESTTTTGTGTITLAGAVSGFQSFSAGIGNGNSTYYTISNNVTNQWEVGIGTYTSAGIPQFPCISLNFHLSPSIFLYLILYPYILPL